LPRIGYDRVSTTDQDLKTQLAKLKAEGWGIVRSENVAERLAGNGCRAGTPKYVLK
jgi:DNA invertase Pin-like site-specific DNA recombinase